jgi:hypothetical protein
VVAHRSCENSQESRLGHFDLHHPLFLHESENAMLADQLREAIENSGRSINSIALAAGVPQPVLQRFVSGERDIRLETADKLADYFGMRLTRPKG